MTVGRFETAVPPGVDLREHTRLLSQVREAALSGHPPPAAPRPLIGASWRRVQNAGLDPGSTGEIPLLDSAALESRRRRSRLDEVLPALRARLVPVAKAAGQIMVVVDADGRVLWREGSDGVRRRADGLGFVEGSAWGECSVGTNAIGTALVLGEPVQVYAAEHYATSHQPWTCAAAPLRDPRDGSLLGAVDLSGPAGTVHATTVALVDAVARLAELELQTAHDDKLRRLRALAAPLLARLPGRALVVDPHGWTAAVTGLPPRDRVALPDRIDSELSWLPGLGRCHLEPLLGGWLVRLADDQRQPPTDVLLDVLGDTCQLTVSGGSGEWRHTPSRRHAEILLILATQRQGRTAAELAADLFDDSQRTVTVRAELSRLRTHLVGVLDHRPYRYADPVRVRVALPDDPRRILPSSCAPAVVALQAGAG